MQALVVTTEALGCEALLGWWTPPHAAGEEGEPRHTRSQSAAIDVGTVKSEERTPPDSPMTIESGGRDSHVNERWQACMPPVGKRP